MKILGIKVHNFMSLKDISIQNLSDNTNYLVGPNGSGKSTIFRALNLIQRILQPNQFNNSDQISDLLKYSTLGSNEQGFDIKIHVSFDTEEEQNLISTFFAAALSNYDEIRSFYDRWFSASSNEKKNKPVTDIGKYLFAEYMLDLFKPTHIPYLFNGELRCTYKHDFLDSLRISYTFQDSQDNPLHLVFGTGYSDGTLVKGRLPENPVWSGNSLSNVLYDFYDRSGDLENIIDVLLSLTTTFVASGNLEQLLNALANANVIINCRGMNFIPSPYPRTVSSLSTIMKLNLQGQNSNISIKSLLCFLISNAIIQTKNLRQPIDSFISYPLASFNEKTNIQNELNLPLYLFKIKNGNLEERKLFLEIQGAFKELVGVVGDLSFDLKYRIQHNTNQDSNQENESHDLESKLEIVPIIIDGENEIPLYDHGAGIWEALIYSVLIKDSKGKIILLDEPASNIHQSMQKKLIERILKASTSGQFLITTHSSHLLPNNASKLQNVYRLFKTKETVSVSKLRTVNNFEKYRVSQELRTSSDFIGLLFSNGVFLVEGETEIAAFNHWLPQFFEKKFGKPFWSFNFSIHETRGKNNISFYREFLSDFAIPHVVICDGDCFNPKKVNSNQNNKSFFLNNLKSIPDKDKSFVEIQKSLEEIGIFTANTDFSDFENIPDVKQIYDQYSTDADFIELKDSKARRADYVSERVKVLPDSIEELFEKALSWLNKNEFGLSEENNEN